MIPKLLKIATILFSSILINQACAQEIRDYQLAAGDIIHILIYQNPDLTLDTRVSEHGTITYPLIGAVNVGGISIADAEKKIGQALEHGGFVKNPQVNISLTQIVGNQVAVLGYVNHPGSYPLLTFNIRISQMLATAGGITLAPNAGSSSVILAGTRGGVPFTKTIDIASIYLDDRSADDLVLSGGDSIYVPKAKMFYIYGQVNKPGQYPMERGLTVMQALAIGGGPTIRGSENRIRLNRKLSDGTTARQSPELSDSVQPDDVIYVNESFF
jgi:polysaccharide export outer membrane protein